jgi:hypothetical protein
LNESFPLKVYFSLIGPNQGKLSFFRRRLIVESLVNWVPHNDNEREFYVVDFDYM